MCNQFLCTCQPATRKEGINRVDALTIVRLNQGKSVSSDPRPTKPIVDTGGDHIDILANAVCRRYANRGGDEAECVTLKKYVVVFHAHRPIRSEAEFEACTHGSAPSSCRSPY